MSDKLDELSFTEDELKDLEDLYQAILTMENPEELGRFFTDLCSKSELHSFLHRWQIVRRIEQGKSYEEIIRELAPENKDSVVSDDQKGTRKGKGRNATKVSSTTISRVKACYNNPEGGYRTALGRLKGDNK